MLAFEGIVPSLERRYRDTDSSQQRERIEEYMSFRPCPVCKGARLKPEVLAVTVGGKSILGGNVRGTVVRNPANDPSGDAQWPHYSPTGAGPNQPQLDFTGLQVGQPSAGTLRVRTTNSA